MIKKYIFVDLDETLFHSRYLGSNATAVDNLRPDKEKLIELISRYEEPTEWYGSCLRPGAHNLLAKLRAIPNSQVMVLTFSVEDYALAHNKAHELGFNHKIIYARDELKMNLVPDLGISNPLEAEYYLIDNLMRRDNSIKIRWMQKLANSAKVTYIKVPEFFSITKDRHFDSALIDDILLQINNLENS